MESNSIQTKTYKHILSARLEDGREFHLPYQIVADGEVWFAEEVEYDGKRVVARIGESEITDVIEIQRPLICVTRRWNLRGAFTARVVFAALRNMKAERWYVPGVLYEAVEDSGAPEAGAVMESLCAVPSLSIVEGGGECLAAFTRPAGSTDDISSVSTQISPDHAQITISVPGENISAEGPLAGILPRAGVRDWKIDGRITYERTFYIYIGPGDRTLNKIVGISWDKMVFQPEPVFNANEIVRAGAKRLLGSFFIERNDGIGFVDGIGSTGYAMKPRLRGGGPGGNVDAARALYRIARMSGHRKLKQAALDTADFFLAGGQKDETLRLDYHPARRRWIKPERGDGSLRATGEMLSAAARINRTAGEVDANPRWLFTARKIADMLFDEWRDSLKDKDESAGLKYSGKPDGVFSPEGPAAPFLSVGFLELFRETGDDRYLQAGAWLAEKAEPGLNGSLYPRKGGAAVMSRDAAHSMLSASLILQRETGDDRFLETAVDAATYLRTMTFIYKTPVPQDSEIYDIEFSTQGAVPPVPGSYHMDPCPAVITPDLLALWKATGEELWRTLGLMMLGFSLRLAAGGESSRRGTFLRQEYNHSFSPSEPGRWGGASGYVSRTISAVIGAVLDVSEEHPDVIEVDPDAVGIEDWKTSGASKALLYLGSHLNFFS